MLNYLEEATPARPRSITFLSFLERKLSESNRKLLANLNKKNFFFKGYQSKETNIKLIIVLTHY